MMIPRIACRLCVSILAFTAFGRSSSSKAGEEIQAGVVVEAVSAHSEAEKAHLQEGDVLLNWSRGESSGELHLLSIFPG